MRTQLQRLLTHRSLESTAYNYIVIESEREKAIVCKAQCIRTPRFLSRTTLSCRTPTLHTLEKDPRFALPVVTTIEGNGCACMPVSIVWVVDSEISPERRHKMVLHKSCLSQQGWGDVGLSHSERPSSEFWKAWRMCKMTRSRVVMSTA